MTAVHTLNLEIRRTRLAAEITASDESVRNWLFEEVTQEITWKGACTPRFKFVGSEFCEAVSLEEVYEPETIPALSAVFRKMALRPEVDHAFWVGEAHLPLGTGVQRAVCILEWYAGIPGPWWLAWRPFETDAEGLGVFGSDWSTLAGAGPDDLPAPLQPWLDTARAEIESYETHPRDLGPEATFGHVALMQPATPPPEAGEDLARWLVSLLEDDPAGSTTPNLLAFAFREQTVERWQVDGNLPCRLVDFMRTVGQQQPAWAVAVLQPCLLETPEGGRRRGHALTIQRFREGRAALEQTEEGEREVVASVCILPSLHADPDSGAPQKAIFQPEEPVDPEDAWLDRAPAMDLQLFAGTRSGGEDPTTGEA